MDEAVSRYFRCDFLELFSLTFGIVAERLAVFIDLVNFEAVLLSFFFYQRENHIS